MRVLVMGAAGRDFHDFNTVFRDLDGVEVVAFTHASGQNLGELETDIDRCYPPELAGENYPEGIPIEPEASLEQLVDSHDVDRVVFSYSDVSHEHVMHTASRALGAGADFEILGPESMMLDTGVPVLAVDAVRTGCGKSQVTRQFARALDDRNIEVRIIREPMPYGDLRRQRVTRIADEQDLTALDATVEEREEYEPHVEDGHVVFAGVDYRAVLDAAAAEADLILWDGGNNELPFVRPDVHVVLVDPLRPGDELSYHPGEATLRRADCVVVNKENTADETAIRRVVGNVRDVNQDAKLVHADSVVTVDTPERVDGARVLVVEDGPTLTHGGQTRGAGSIAAEKFGAGEQVDPRDGAVGSLSDVFERYDHLGDVLPAMGYSDDQVADLEATIRNVDCDLVLAGTPHDLTKQVEVDVPVETVSYRVEPHQTTFDDLLSEYTARLGL